jgi:hypothetical protein
MTNNTIEVMVLNIGVVFEKYFRTFTSFSRQSMLQRHKPATALRLTYHFRRLLPCSTQILISDVIQQLGDFTPRPRFFRVFELVVRRTTKALLRLRRLA